MKIGILTYHRAENYGALLQAYGLKTYLQELGHEVSFVDYWPTYHSDYFRIFPLTKYKKGNVRVKLGLLRRSLTWSCLPKYLRKFRLQHFMKSYLELDAQPKYTQGNEKTDEYDVVVYGSDQIWRKQNLGGVLFDSWYFGSDNVQAKRKIVYAGSMGTVKTTAEDDSFIKNAMQNFSCISVRENDLQNYLQSLGISSTIVTDPVFLLDKKQWERIAKPSEKRGQYILFYNLLRTPESTQFAENLSRQTGLPICELNKQFSYQHIRSRYIGTASVESFLGLIEGAAYVVSNSFHGVAFSIIFEKQFFAVGMNERANRVISLLKNTGITQRYVESSNVPMNMPDIDYVKVKQNLQERVLQSKQYLIESIE